MKPSFSEVIDSPQYEKAASAMSKAHILVATIVCIAMMIWSEYRFGLWWFVVVPVIWFFVSLFIAAPFMYMKIKLSLRLASTPSRVAIIANIVDMVSYIANPLIVYFVLRLLHRVAF